MNFENLTVILVEPQGPLNIGAVCRAMMNFGFSDLRLVRPQVDHLVEDARRMAVKATPLLERATLYPGLEKALEDCHFAFGTTRRFGKYREDFLHPDESAKLLLPLLKKGRVALVFGREDKGLHTAELDLCQRLLTIPTSNALPSMNLAQSVTVCLYEVSRKAAAMKMRAPSGRKSLATVKSLENMYSHMHDILFRIGYLDPQNPDHILRTFRRIFGRSGLNDRDVRVLRGLWSRIEWLEDERRKLGEKDRAESE
ncbi:MAG: RNA methyltransferase [Syntrophotaleaceae bacterium]